MKVYLVEYQCIRIENYIISENYQYETKLVTSINEWHFLSNINLGPYLVIAKDMQKVMYSE